MSDDHSVEERWREWARGQGVPGERLEPAVEAAMRVAGSGAGVEAAAAAARLAGGCGRDGDLDLLRGGLARTGVVLEELGGLRAAGPLTAAALEALSGIFEARRRALAEAVETGFEPAPAPAPAAAAAPRRPAAPTLRQFFTEHSILLLSDVGAFLLVVAAVLYEVYAIGELSGGLRFAGVLALDLVFGAAGWACLRSPRMRLVGHTYVAVFALLAPLVGVAAYVFLGLRQEGISLEMALLLIGAALTVLYGVLCLRLRSQAYGFLALAALAVAWLGGIETAGSGAWNGPVAAVLLPAYALTAFGARAVPGLGERFAARAALFVHGAVLLALAVTLGSAGSVVSPAASATLAVVGAGYLLARLLNGMPAAAHLGLAALGLAWAVAAHALGLGGWISVALMPLVAAYSLLGRSGTFVAPAARDLVPGAALLVSGLTAVLWAGELSAGHGTAWWLPAALALLAGAYALHGVLTGQARALLVTAAAASRAVLA
ncbi:MAG TPA: hypothetical protein VLW53_15540, partial [Candidatus Eisenbacteria bacterium]|nr:hypothetical protein [Candidatus Eisenbacteria bacterium]